MVNNVTVISIIQKTKDSILWRIYKKIYFCFKKLFKLIPEQINFNAAMKKVYCVSFSEKPKEQSGHEICLNLKSFLSKYNTKLKILY